MGAAVEMVADFVGIMVEVTQVQKTFVNGTH